MCGIVGYVGQQEAAPILLDGLRRLEYRGYDSAGIAVCGDGQLRVKKSRGRLQVLSDLTHDGADLPGHLGIGHTRWATHGEPNDVNAHPHVSQSGRIAVVHNGIIESYSPSRKLDRISYINLAIMKIALYEMKYCPSVPDKVAINEAIEFAKEYADKTDVRFINGVLNSYYKDNPTKEQPDA